MGDDLRLRVAKRIHAITADVFREMYKGDPELVAAVSDWDSDVQSAESVAAFFAVADAILPLLEALELLRLNHYECEDSWYSCPKSDDGCSDDTQTECNCGARARNALITQAREKFLGEEK